MTLLTQRPFPSRTGWVLVGLILAWNVAQGSLLQLAAVAPIERLANALFLVGAAASLFAHELAQRAVERVTRVRLDGRPGPTLAPVGEAPVRASGGRRELAAPAAGPIASFCFAAAVLGIARIAYVAGFSDALIRSMAAVATLSFVLALVNLLPLLPLDGGRFLQASLRARGFEPARAARMTGMVTEVAALLIIAAGLAVALTADLADALSWILLGVILQAEGRAARAGSEPGARARHAEAAPRS
jgi:Zn-dependent protease